MKKTVLTLLMAIAGIASASAYDFIIDDLYYNINDDGKSVTVGCAYSGQSYIDIIIPPNVTNNGTTYSVTEIGYKGFSECSILSVRIPDSVTNIGESAFERCSGLTSITIPNYITEIDKYAFRDCSNLTNVTIGNSVEEIGDCAFERCSSLSNINIPNSVIYIRAGAFADCSSLTSLTIGNSLWSIGDYAFRNCKNLTTIYWNAKDCDVPNDYYSAFKNCPSIKTVIIGDGVATIPSSFMHGISSLTNVYIPNSVTKIGSLAFDGCSSLTSVNIPNSVTEIEFGAFEDCTSLTSITIPNSVTSIGERVFMGCKGLTSISIPNSITIIDRDLFSGCSSLTNFNIPNSVTRIGWDAFYGCSSLTSITIPKSVTYIETAWLDYDGILAYCSGLTSIVVEEGNPSYDSRNNCNAIIATDGNYLIAGCQNTIIPNTITHINRFAFRGQSRLQRITIPNSVTSIGECAFEDCTSLTSINIPNSVTEIDGWAFARCTGLTNVTIGNSVTDIYSSIFAGCSNLKSVTIPNSVTEIPAETFKDCISLPCITIPGSITSIGIKAFNGCSSLTRIDSYADPDKVEMASYYGEVVFDKFHYANCQLHVLPKYLDGYKSANQWKDFLYIIGDLEERAVVEKGTNVTENSFTALWGGFSSDSFDLYVYKERETVREDFDNATVESLQSAGWQFGEKVACDDGALRLGTSSAGGRLTTPSLGVFSGDAALSFDIKAYPNAKDIGKTVDIVVLGSGSSSINSITTSEEYERYNLTISGVSEATKVILTSHDDANNRFLIDNVVISTLGTSSRLSKATFEERFDNEALTAEQLTTAGWQMVKGFVEDKALRLGTSSVGGEVTTPALGAKRDAVVTFDIKAYPNNKDLGKIIDVSVVGEGYADITDITTTADFSTYTISLTGITEETKLKLASHTAANNRFIIDNLMVTSGKAVWQLLEGYPVNTAEYSHEVTGLEPGSSYSYYVIAKNEIGDEADMSNIQIVSTLPGAAAAAAGDINGDSSVDGNDVSILLEMVLAGGVNAEQMPVADINGDNSVDGNDVSILLEMVLSGN